MRRRITLVHHSTIPARPFRTDCGAGASGRVLVRHTSEDGKVTCPRCLARMRHRERDPHCSCNDCIGDMDFMGQAADEDARDALTAALNERILALTPEQRAALEAWLDALPEPEAK